MLALRLPMFLANIFIVLGLLFSFPTGANASQDLDRYKVYPWQLLHDPKFKQEYMKVTDGLRNLKWIREIDATAPQNRIVNINGKDYVYIEFCKPHNCADEMVFMLYDPENNKIIGSYITNVNGKYVEVPLGRPTAEELKHLHKLMKRLSSVSL